MKPIFLFFTALLLLAASGCSKSGGSPDPVPVTQPSAPTVSTDSAKSVTTTSAILGGNVTADGGATVTTRGICWKADTASTFSSPTPNDNNVVCDGTTGTMSANLTGLTANTIYYARAYAINKAGIGYGKSIKFQTYAVADKDGNFYHTVKIGAQIWLVENLKATHYLNGDPVNKVVADNYWMCLTTGAYCDYNNSNDTAMVYGRLYNWYATTDSRKFIKGFHTGSQADWMVMYNYLGKFYSLSFPYLAGPHMMGSYGWSNPKPNSAIDNATGFTAIPNGAFSMTNNGSMSFVSLHTDFSSWTSDDLGDMSVTVDIDQANCFFEAIQVYFKFIGLGIRLLAD